ncbi:MAG: rhodanese-like domain-containing protein [Deltaproteobacteria bacterium]|nr:rhodanese-like domain-containing protein [Deltaproteobacteria bacterium]
MESSSSASTPSALRAGLTAVAVAATMAAVSACTPSPDEITPAQLRAALDQGQQLVVVDVREDGEWAGGHMRAARSVPLSRMSGTLDGVDKGAAVVLYCRSGKRSMRALEMMKGAGYTNVKSLAGGISAWQSEVDPELTRY